MRRTQKMVILSRLSRELIERGSWDGETHLQKAVFLLQELTGVPLEYDFILYRHGPFSFDLREELNRMRADGLLDLIPQPHPYGPSFRPTGAAFELEGGFPRTLKQFDEEIEYVADLVGSKSATRLEQLGTAVLLLRDMTEQDDQELAERFVEIKPRVSREVALDALKEMREAAYKSPRAPV